MSPLRIAYLAGPANGPEIFKQWSGVGRQGYVGTDYMKQFLQLGDDLDAECYVVTWHPGRAVTQCGRFTFDNSPLLGGRRWRYYAGMLAWHLRLLPKLIRFRPDVLILTGNQNWWWTLAPIRAARLPSFHCALWPVAGKSVAARFLLKLEELFVLRGCKAIVATSRAIALQVWPLTDAKIFRHLPTYTPDQFADIPAPRWSHSFRIIFAARIEGNKGVFDVVEMARRLPEVRFDVCGAGSALAEAKAVAPGNVRFHGFCDQARMAELMGKAHAAVVPTRSDFEAGFEMTCSEAVLSGRPLITSAVCPALEYLRPASIEVRADDPTDYAAAIASLAGDRARYEKLCAACIPLQGQFYDQENSWLVAMKKALSLILTSAPVPSSAVPSSARG